MLLQIVLSGRVTQEVLISTLQVWSAQLYAGLMIRQCIAMLVCKFLCLASLTLMNDKPMQRQSRDVQDATIKLFVNFTARCAPQNRCQVAAVCAVADMTAFANLLVTSKLEVRGVGVVPLMSLPGCMGA